MTIDEFADETGIDDPEGYEIFREALAARTTLATQSADLADGLRRLGVGHESVMAAVGLLAKTRGR